MRLTKQSTYAVRALIYCAKNDPNLSQVRAIANAYGISESFLFKLIKPLVENGLLETVRGRRGGIRLARSAASITLLDSIQLTEESFDFSECLEDEDGPCPLIGHCSIHQALASALRAFQEQLASKTVADLVDGDPQIAQKLGISN